jgi:hypothetical protein
MVNQFSAEKRFRGEFFDFLCVFRVIPQGARLGLSQAARREQTHR